jgi:selenium-binding protein 1
MKPALAGSVRVGGIAQHAQHPSGRPFGGGPQMTEISRDGKRVYFTNSLYSAWDPQFYPDGVPGVQAMCKVGNNGGGIELDPEFYVDFGQEYGAHQIRLQGGDCSTDSFCYTSA